jgi:hypothetical protein
LGGRSVSENPRDRQLVEDVIEAAKWKAFEHLDYSIRPDDPNDLPFAGLEHLRTAATGDLTEEQASVFIETTRDYGFRIGARRGAEEMLARILERLGVESLEEAESCVQKGKEGES